MVVIKFQGLNLKEITLGYCDEVSLDIVSNHSQDEGLRFHYGGSMAIFISARCLVQSRWR